MCNNGKKHFIQHLDKIGTQIIRLLQQWRFTYKTNCSLGKRNRTNGVNGCEGKLTGFEG